MEDGVRTASPLTYEVDSINAETVSLMQAAREHRAQASREGKSASIDEADEDVPPDSAQRTGNVTSSAQSTTAPSTPNGFTVETTFSAFGGVPSTRLVPVHGRSSASLQYQIRYLQCSSGFCSPFLAQCTQYFAISMVSFSGGSTDARSTDFHDFAAVPSPLPASNDLLSTSEHSHGDLSARSEITSDNDRVRRRVQGEQEKEEKVAVRIREKEKQIEWFRLFTMLTSISSDTSVRLCFTHAAVFLSR
uniref:Unspecified product n=1 Tax=Steinernema glaseri TaxID=37863 RepID=A0A1I7YXK4_9BILA